VINALAEGGVKFIAMRCAGYDRVDVAAANAAGIKVGGAALQPLPRDPRATVGGQEMGCVWG
jgi:hypothetical protein